MSNQPQQKPSQQNPNQQSQGSKPEASKGWEKDSAKSQTGMRDQSPSRDQFRSDASKK